MLNLYQKLHPFSSQFGQPPALWLVFGVKLELPVAEIKGQVKQLVNTELCRQPTQNKMFEVSFPVFSSLSHHVVSIAMRAVMLCCEHGLSFSSSHLKGLTHGTVGKSKVAQYNHQYQITIISLSFQIDKLKLIFNSFCWSILSLRSSYCPNLHNACYWTLHFIIFLLKDSEAFCLSLSHVLISISNHSLFLIFLNKILTLCNSVLHYATLYVRKKLIFHKRSY